MHLKETFLDLVYAQKKKKDLAYNFLKVIHRNKITYLT
jgi:hypothetical protein